MTTFDNNLKALSKNSKNFMDEWFIEAFLETSNKNKNKCICTRLIKKAYIVRNFKTSKFVLMGTACVKKLTKFNMSPAIINDEIIKKFEKGIFIKIDDLHQYSINVLEKYIYTLDPQELYKMLGLYKSNKKIKLMIIACINERFGNNWHHLTFFINKWFKCIEPMHKFVNHRDHIIDIVNKQNNHIYVNYSLLNNINYSSSRNIWILSIQNNLRPGKLYNIVDDDYLFVFERKADLFDFDLDKCKVYLDDGSNIFRLSNNCDIMKYYIISGSCKTEVSGLLVEKINIKKFLCNVFDDILLEKPAFRKSDYSKVYNKRQADKKLDKHLSLTTHSHNEILKNDIISDMRLDNQLLLHQSTNSHSHLPPGQTIAYGQDDIDRSIKKSLIEIIFEVCKNNKIPIDKSIDFQNLDIAIIRNLHYQTFLNPKSFDVVAFNKQYC